MSTTEPLASTLDADPPTPLPITDLTDISHVKFIRSFQGRFDDFHGSDGSSKHGSQIKWVTKNVMGEFQAKFGSISSDLLIKVDRYLRNHSNRNHKVTTRPAVPNTSTRAVSWLRILEDNKKDAIITRATALREREGWNASGDHFSHFKRARQEVADLLPEDEVKRYKDLAEVVTRTRKAPPTPAVVFERQPAISMYTASVIRNQFGWEAGQLGDAICFFAVVYRAEDQSIKSQFTTVSNLHLPQEEMAIPDMTNIFSEHVAPSLKGIADKYIPRGAQQPQFKLEVDINHISPNALQEALLQHVTTSWVASDAQTKKRTPDNLPWSELETPEGQEHYLVNHIDFVLDSFLCLTNSTSYNPLHALATKFMLPHTSPLFKSPSTTTSSPVITPPSPVITPPSPVFTPPSPVFTTYPSPPNSRRQNTPSVRLPNSELGAITVNTEPVESPPSELVMELPSQPTSVPASRPLTTSSQPIFTSALPLTFPTPTPSTIPQPEVVPATMGSSEASEGGGGTPADVRGAEESPGQDQGTSNGIVGKATSKRTLGKRKRTIETTSAPLSTRQLRSSKVTVTTTTTQQSTRARRKNSRKK